MKKITAGSCILFLLLLLHVPLQAQSSRYKVGKVKCVKVQITDPGEFYSTYEFEKSDIEFLKESKLSDADIEKIKMANTESTWPAQLGNFDVRIQQADKIKNYTVYKIAEFGDKYLLVAPAKYNRDMGEGWAPQNDIYFVVGKSGVKI